MYFLGRKTKNNYDDYNYYNDEEFERQMQLAIQESQKDLILMDEEKQIELAIKESLKDKQFNNNIFFGNSKTKIILDDNENKYDENLFKKEIKIETNQNKEEKFIKLEEDDKKKLIIDDFELPAERKKKKLIKFKTKNNIMNKINEYKIELKDLLDNYSIDDEEHEQNEEEYEGPEENEEIKEEQKITFNNMQKFKEEEENEEIPEKFEKEEEKGPKIKVTEEIEEIEKEEKKELVKEIDQGEEDEEKKKLELDLKKTEEDNQKIKLFTIKNCDIELNELENEEYDENYGICPITHDYMKHPVLTPSGIYYEKSAIKKWLKKSKTDPISRQYLTVNMLQEDKEYRKRIKKYKKKLNK